MGEKAMCWLKEMGAAEIRAYLSLNSLHTSDVIMLFACD